MRPDWRHQLWLWLTRHLKDGEIPPRRFLLALALLFPRRWFLRHQLWLWLTRHLKDGEVPRRRFLLARALLFPRQALLWWLQQDNGHDPLSLNYRHGGVAIPLRFLDAIARAADGESFVIVKCTHWPEPCITWRPVPPPLLIQPKN